MRNQKLDSYNENIVKEANAIADRFIDFTDGVRCMLLLHRKKEGMGGGHPHHSSPKRISVTREEYVENLCVLLDLFYKSDKDLRIYASCNPRNMRKAIRRFKELQLDNDYADNDTHLGFYADIDNRFFSALMREKDDNLFIIDIDDNSIMGTVDKLVAELELTVYNKYATKNGWHIVVAPFNPSLWSLEGTEIKKDGLILIKY